MRAFAVVAFPFVLAAQHPAPWRQYADPADAGFDAAKLAAVGEQAQGLGSAAVLVVFRGHVLCAFGEVELPLPCHSVRKSLVGALAGIAVDAGELDLDATLERLGVDDREPLSADERRATVRDLLRSRSGVYHPAAKETADMKRSRPGRGTAGPGERFWYNNWDFNVAAVAIAKATGTDVLTAFARELAAPLGMEDFAPGDARWELEPSTSRHPAYDFRLSARDLARFGWLFACSGEWHGRRLVSAAWVADSTAVRSPEASGSGYATMWWSYPAGSLAGPELDALARERMFAAIGTGGQLVLVLPDAALVFVHRADTDAGRHVRGPQVWRLAEAVLDARTGEPVAAPRLGPLAPVRFANRAVVPPLPAAVPLTDALRRDVAGQYAADVPGGLRLTVHVHDGRLFALAHGEGEVELLSAGGDRLFAPAERSLRIELVRDAAGAVTTLGVTLQGRTLRLARR